MLRICIKNACFKLLLLCLSCFNSWFASHFFKNVLPAYTGSMILQNDFKQFQSKFSLFWPPNGLHKSYFCHFCSLLSSLGSFGSLFFRSVPPSKFWLWPMTCAFLASRALSAKMTVCIAPLILQNSYAIYNFLCAIHDSSTFFYKTSTFFGKNCFLPSVGSIILKAGQKRSHDKYPSWAIQLCPYAPFLHHCLQHEICKDHWESVYFLFMAPFGKLHLASSALSHGSKVTFPLSRFASGLIL